MRVSDCRPSPHRIGRVEPVRPNASPVNPAALSSGPENVIVPDYEVTSGVTYTYTAQIVVITGTNASVISASTTSLPVSITTSGFWEFNPSDPSTAVLLR